MYFFTNFEFRIFAKKFKKTKENVREISKKFSIAVNHYSLKYTAK